MREGYLAMFGLLFSWAFGMMIWAMWEYKKANNKIKENNKRSKK